MQISEAEAGIILEAIRVREWARVSVARIIGGKSAIREQLG